MKGHGFGRLAFLVALLCIATTAISSAQTLTTLVSFNGNNGQSPETLVQGANGNFYGTTALGGPGCTQPYSFCGTVFELTAKGINTLYQFCSQPNCRDGALLNPIMLGPDGNFFGSARQGGNVTAPDCGQFGGCGTLFEITPAGKVTILHTFCSQSNCADGADPVPPPIFGINGSLYGTAGLGGSSAQEIYCPYGCGTIYELAPTGKFTTLHEFCSSALCTDGMGGNGLTLASDGTFYGTSNDSIDGPYDSPAGTFFSMTSTGQFTSLYQFCQTNCEDGAQANYPLIQAPDGNFYGTTIGGGSPGFNGQEGGTVFKMTPEGHLTTLYSFCAQANCTDGWLPSALVLATDGNFYGTTAQGGIYQNCQFGDPCGSIFRITPAGEITTLYSFCAQVGCPDGRAPEFPLIQGTDGNLYGATGGGGSGTNCSDGCGTLFRLSLGLKPFVESVPTFGKPGAVIGILGNNLTGSTSVTFDGTPATFTVKSSTLIEATVPSGANTGTIEVTTPSGVLSSNVAFVILP